MALPIAGPIEQIRRRCSIRCAGTNKQRPWWHQFVR